MRPFCLVFFFTFSQLVQVQPLRLGYLIGCSLGIAPGINLRFELKNDWTESKNLYISCILPIYFMLSLFHVIYSICLYIVVFCSSIGLKKCQKIHTYDIILRENMLDDCTEINWLLSCIIMDLLWSILFGTVWNMDCMLDSLNHSVWTSDPAKEPTWNRVHKQVPSLSLL